MLKGRVKSQVLLEGGDGGLYPIVEKRPLARGIHLMKVKAPEIAAKAQAGHFVILRLDEKGERIPLTIADYDPLQGTITCIFQEVGFTTRILAKLEAGDSLADFIGPLGVPSEIEYFGTVVCVGGGIGIAPIFPIARALKEKGNKVVGIIGARTKELLIWEKEMSKVTDELLVTTDDGSYGYCGFVSDVLKQVLEERKEVARVWSIGPVVMMRAVAETTRPFGIRTIVSMNPIMVDGTGMCGACRVSVGSRTKFACVDGPEFDAHLVDWELALRRMDMYKEEEERALLSLGKGVCKCR